jgi:hypothetical protein
MTTDVPYTLVVDPFARATKAVADVKAILEYTMLFGL